MMKDIMQKLAELEATAPKITKKKMLNEDSTTPPMNVSDKPASLKDMFENIAMQKPIPVVGKQGDTQHTGAGFLNINDTSPAGQAMQKALTDLAGQGKAQIVMPTQPGQPQATAAGKPAPTTTAAQPAPAGATGQPQAGQLQMKEKDEGKPGKNFAKIAKSAGARYGSKEAGERVAGAVRAKLAKQGKLEEEPIDEISKGKAMQALQDVSSDPDDGRSYSLQQKIGKKWPEMKGHAADAAYTSVYGRTDRDSFQDPDKLAARAKTSYRMNKGGTANKQDLKARFRREVDEGDIAPTDGIDTKGAGLGAGRSMTTLEGKEPQVEVIDNAFNRENYKDLIGKKYPKSKAPSYARVKEVTEGKKGVNPFAKKDDKASTKAPAKGKKPDFLDLDKDGNKKEPMKKAAADKKKKKVDESMNHRISAARFEGKAHGLKGHAHCGKSYEDLGEMKAYHEGYKEGLDECYGQGVYETAPAMPAATVPGMASAAMPTMEDDMEEGNAFTAALAKTPKGGKFSVGGKTFTDRTGYDAKVNEYAFESLDQQLNALLNESEEVNEGLSVSISKGQQNSPDSVTITAQDQEAEHLLAFVKNAGLGLFGDDNADTHSSAMSVQPSHGAPDEVGAGGIDIGVVDGHDGMMGLMQKLSGVEASGAEDYADEEGDEEQLYGNHQAAGKKDCGCDGDCECSDYDQPSNEDTCDECGGMMEAGHSCGSKEMVDEVESEDQMEFEVSEANAPDSGEAESTADEDAEAQEDMALAKSDSKGGTYTVNEDGDEASEEGPESKEGGTDEEGETVSESFMNLFKKLAFIAEESQAEEDDKAEKAAKKVAKDIEYDEGHKGKDDNKAEKAGEKVKKDIEYDDKKDKKEKVDEWANQVGSGPGKGTDASFEQDIDFMTKVIAGGLNKPKSTGQTTIPVIAGQDDRMIDSPKDWATLAGIKK